MADDAAMEIAGTLQTAHINRHPDPAHDMNPSTAASRKEPVRFRRSPSASGLGSDEEIPLSILEPVRRQPLFPAIPDLRFEQSYLARIKPYSDAGNYGMVAWYTFWDHMVMPLAQGMLLKLIGFGWRQFNRDSRFKGAGAGARVRRWWWGVNNWKTPEQVRADEAEEFFVDKFGSGGGD